MIIFFYKLYFFEGKVFDISINSVVKDVLDTPQYIMNINCPKLYL